MCQVVGPLGSYSSVEVVLCYSGIAPYDGLWRRCHLSDYMEQHMLADITVSSHGGPIVPAFV